MSRTDDKQPTGIARQQATLRSFSVSTALSPECFRPTLFLFSGSHCCTCDTPPSGQEDMPPSTRAPWPLLLSSVLGGIVALCLFMYSLETPAVSAIPRIDQRASPRRLQGSKERALPYPKSSQSSEPDSPRTTSTAAVEGDDAGAGGGGAPPFSDTASGGCWVFMHLQKCGGSTVKKMLADRWGSRYFVYDSMRWKLGDDFSRGFGEKMARGDPWNVLAGGYPEALRRSAVVDASCRFFTVFRHPISRLVSAYYYCQVLELDVACASNIVRARDVDLLTFAKHWSNFAVRQFALSQVPADDVMA